MKKLRKKFLFLRNLRQIRISHWTCHITHKSQKLWVCVGCRASLSVAKMTTNIVGQRWQIMWRGPNATLQISAHTLKPHVRILFTPSCRHPLRMALYKNEYIVTYVWRLVPGVWAVGWWLHRPSFRTWRPTFCSDTPAPGWSRELCGTPLRPSSEWTRTCKTKNTPWMVPFHMKEIHS